MEKLQLWRLTFLGGCLALLVVLFQNTDTSRLSPTEQIVREALDRYSREEFPKFRALGIDIGLDLTLTGNSQALYNHYTDFVSVAQAERLYTGLIDEYAAAFKLNQSQRQQFARVMIDSFVTHEVNHRSHFTLPVVDKEGNLTGGVGGLQTLRMTDVNASGSFGDPALQKYENLVTRYSSKPFGFRVGETTSFLVEAQIAAKAAQQAVQSGDYNLAKAYHEYSKTLLENSIGFKSHIDSVAKHGLSLGMESARFGVRSMGTSTSILGETVGNYTFTNSYGENLTVQVVSPTDATVDGKLHFMGTNLNRQTFSVVIEARGLGLSVPRTFPTVVGFGLAKQGIDQLGLTLHGNKVFSADFWQRAEYVGWTLDAVRKEVINKSSTSSFGFLAGADRQEAIMSNWPKAVSSRASDVPPGFLHGEMEMPLPKANQNPGGSSSPPSTDVSGPNTTPRIQNSGGKTPARVMVSDFKDFVKYQSELSLNAAAKGVSTGLKGNAIGEAIGSFVRAFSLYGEAYEAATTDGGRQLVANEILRQVGGDVLLGTVILPATPSLAGGGLAIMLRAAGVGAAKATAIGGATTLGLGLVIIGLPVYQFATDPVLADKVIEGFLFAKDNPWDYSKFYMKTLWFTSRAIYQHGTSPIPGMSALDISEGGFCLPCLFDQDAAKLNNLALRVLKRLEDPRIKSVEEAVAAVAAEDAALLDQYSFSELAGDFSEDPKNDSQDSSSVSVPPANPTDHVFFPAGFSSLVVPNNNGSQTSNITVTVPSETPSVKSISSVAILPGQPKKSAGHSNGQWNVWVWPDGVESNVGQSYGVQSSVNPIANRGYWRRSDGKEFLANFADHNSLNPSQTVNILSAGGGVRRGTASEAGRIELAVATAPTIEVTRTGSRVISRSPNGTNLSAPTKSAISGNSAITTGAVPIERPKPIHGIPLGQAIPRL